MIDDGLNEREILSAKISRHAAEGWRDFCARHGISLTSYLEVSGRELAQEAVPPRVPEMPQLVESARQVDLQRRSRKRKSAPVS